MKEVPHDKGLYTEEEFAAAVDEGQIRQAETAEEVFSALESRQIDTITLMRIYDVLGAILNKLDEDACTALMNKHANGGLAGPPPSLNI
jgi:hypothetical protein